MEKVIEENQSNFDLNNRAARPYTILSSNNRAAAAKRNAVEMK